MSSHQSEGLKVQGKALKTTKLQLLSTAECNIQAERTTRWNIDSNKPHASLGLHTVAMLCSNQSFTYFIFERNHISCWINHKPHFLFVVLRWINQACGTKQSVVTLRSWEYLALAIYSWKTLTIAQFAPKKSGFIFICLVWKNALKCAFFKH